MCGDAYVFEIENVLHKSCNCRRKREK